MLPIVRGRCTACGYSRNLWVNELPAEDLACDHASMGCRGQMKIAWVGPKSMLPSELDRAHMECTCRQPQALACGEDLARLCEMGFPEEAAKQALADVSNRAGDDGSRMEAAIDHLMAQPSAEPANSRCGASCGSSAAAASSSRSRSVPYPGGLPASPTECAICTEELELANVAMRCSGQHGKRHYYHEKCLSQWIQQCRRANQPPTCPECRGELQVRQGRLRDFLEDHSGKLDREDMEALRAVHDAAEDADTDGWAGLKKEHVLTGLAVGAGVAVAGLALAAVMGAFKGGRGDKDRRQ